MKPSKQKQSIKYAIYFLSMFVFIIPNFTYAEFAPKKCSSVGYTVATINGVLTDEEEAKWNMRELRKVFGLNYNNQSIDYQYLLNSTHLGGLGDFADVVVQKAFENETVEDYDLIEILKDASAKVKTQKLLLVAHSQGNFYANSFYDVVAGQTGGLPAQSIGVYSVATPASRVAGNGRWLTSDTDKVIATTVGNVPFKSIKTPNTHIALQHGDDFMGHDFADVYLKYRSTNIVEDVRTSLQELSADDERREDSLCIDPPNITFGHKAVGVALAVTDPILNPAGKGVRWAVGTGIDTAVFAYTTTVAVGKWTYHVAIAATVWLYDTSLATAKFVGGTAITVGSVIYDAVSGILPGRSIAGSNNSASVILATQQPDAKLPVPVYIQPKTQPQPSQLVVFAPELNEGAQLPVVVPVSSVSVLEPVVSTQSVFVAKSAPKLVFVGLSPGFGGGMPAQAAPQVLGTTTETTETANEETTSFNEESDLPPLSLSAPAVSAPQCAFSLATDGCLIATTTVRFEWGAVSGATHYALNNNGVFATTTDTAIDVIAGDFSEYTFGVAAIGPNNESSATSTQIVSVATIPIAINEIAWMGTSASSNDEWFEIKNNTAHTIDLSQWELNAKDGTPHVKLAGSIAPHKYLVFERTNDTVFADVKAHQRYTGALGNSGEQLNLSYASTTLDQTPDGAWVAGDRAGKKTMERYSSRERGDDPNNWGTNLGYVKNGIDADGHEVNGTPGSQNSVSMLINKGEDITSDFTVTADEERYVVPGFVQVRASSTLTIAPGVKISFLNDNKGHDGYLFVKGSIDAQGTAEDPVIFNSSSGGFAPDIWFGGSAATSTFDQVKFENMGSIGVYKSNLEVRNSEFSNTTGGINAYVDSTVIVENSSFTNESRDALGVYTNSVMSIASSSITDQLGGDGIGAYGESVLTVASTTIKNVKKGVGIGVYDSTLLVSSTTIESINTGDGIGAYDATSTITNVDITNTGRDGIGVYSGTATMTDINVSNSARDGIVLYESISTLSNINVTGSGRDGIDVYDGVVNVTDVKVSDSEDVGILVSSSGEPAVITNGEVFNNGVGVSIEGDSAILNDVSVHDNGEGDEDNIVVY